MGDDNGRAKMTSLFFQEKNGSLHKAVTEIPLAQCQTQRGLGWEESPQVTQLDSSSDACSSHDAPQQGIKGPKYPQVHTLEPHVLFSGDLTLKRMFPDYLQLWFLLFSRESIILYV